MRTLSRVVGVLTLLAGLCGCVICVWALIDPSIMAPTSTDSAFAPPSPRWRAFLGLVFSVAMLLFGAGKLHHRERPHQESCRDRS